MKVLWQIWGALRRAFGLRWEDRHFPQAWTLDCWRYWKLAGWEVCRVRLCKSTRCRLTTLPPVKWWDEAWPLAVPKPAGGWLYPGLWRKPERMLDEGVWLLSWTVVLGCLLGLVMAWGQQEALSGLRIQDGSEIPRLGRSPQGGAGFKRPGHSERGQ